MNKLFELPKPVIFSHRGYSANAPENTLAAFELAIQHGAEAVELDAKMSSDGEVVVIHDQTVDRTTNGKGRVNQLTLVELKALDAGSSFDAKFAGEKVPTLAEVFETIGGRALINVELTNYESHGDDLLPKVTALVKKFGLQDGIIFSSFHPLNIIKARMLLPGVPAGLLTLEADQGKLLRAWPGRLVAPALIHPWLDDATDEFINAEHRRGRRVHVWTVNKAEDMTRLFNVGVDGIFTDDPVLAQKLLGRA
ncbi:MAG: glycerophosphodiester phosphodiesterase [Anaerolineaceae bacterium]|nr:glycerophosphodiester phosphodiesterase [Anaerolineaceae bacterium]NTV35824.1 glycerophosphodiester phosphodiesterase [Anaerolineaceae bacterium]